jgi:hypothetical protein
MSQINVSESTIQNQTCTKTETVFSLIGKVRSLHAKQKLAGEPRNAILSAPDELIAYILSLLRDQPPALPTATQAEWYELLDLLSSHGIIPWIYWRAGHLPRELRPLEAVTDRMREVFLASRARSFLMETQLRGIEDAFNREDVRVLVLKGPALAWRLYPDPATRPSGDIDLLVRPEEFIKSRNILENMGYECLGKRFENSRDFFCEEIFIHKSRESTPRQVELHWDLLRFSGACSNLEMDDLFQRAVELRASALTFEVLNPVDELIHAALHLNIEHSQDIRLIWIYDIRLLARALAVPDDWVSLQKRSMDSRAVIAVRNSLQMARFWAGLELPAGFDDLSTWPEPEQIEISTWSHVVRQRRSIMSNFRLSWIGSSNIFERARSLFHLVFPDPKMIRLNYPTSHKWLLPLSYIRRWWRWLTISVK